MGTLQTIEVANLGMWDSLILMVMALVVFGPRRLPEIGRQVGKLMYEIRKASNDFKFQMEEELRNAEDAERRQKEEERLRSMALAAAAPAELPAQIPTQVIDAQFPAADAVSPYPGETLYPVQPSAEAPARPEETFPKIQPPSTGEPVPAARPWSLEEELAKVSGAGATLDTAVAAAETPIEDGKDENTAATETAEHHG